MCSPAKLIIISCCITPRNHLFSKTLLSFSILHTVIYRGRNFCRRNFRRRNYRRRNFRRRIFCRQDFSPYEIFTVRNFRRMEFSPYGIFAVWNFRRNASFEMFHGVFKLRKIKIFISKTISSMYLWFIYKT